MGSPKRNSESFNDHGIAGNPQFVTALARGMSILRCFDREVGELGNQEIVARTGLPKPTVSRLTFTLASLGYLSYCAAREKYSLGIGVLAFARAFVNGHDLIAIARPLMQELADYTKAAVMLGASDGSHMVLLDIRQGDEIFSMKLEPGSRVPHRSTALGRAYMAALRGDDFEQHLKKLRTQCTPAAWPKVKAGIALARRDYEHYGFCFSLGEWNPDVFAVGVPVVSADKTRIVAFSVSGRVSVVTREQILGDFGPRLVALRNKVLGSAKDRF